MKRFFLLLLLIISYTGQCQYYLKIDSLMIYNIVESEPENTITEQFGEGPSVYGYFTFYNSTEEPLFLQQSDYILSYFYYYEKVRYSSLYLHFSMNQTPVVINAGDSISFECGTRLMIDVDLHKSQRYSFQSSEIINHSEIFKSILPSLNAELIIQDSIHVASSINTWIFEYDNIEESGRPIKIYPNNPPMETLPPSLNLKKVDTFGSNTKSKNETKYTDASGVQ